MPQPHDRLFKDVFGEPRYAAQHLREALPPEVLAQVDLSTLKRVQQSFVSPELKERHADLLFTAKLNDGRDVCFYLLFEHQSSPDPMMAYRMVGYTLLIWQSWLRRNPEAKRLPLVYPLVLYHGERTWRAPMDLADLIDLPLEAREAFAPAIPSWRYDLGDLSDVPDETLQRGALVAMVKLLFKHYHQEDLLDRLPDWKAVFKRAAEEDGLRAIELAARYILKVSDKDRGERVLKQLFTEVAGPEAEEVVMSIADRIEARGLAKGLKQGRQEGRVAQARALLLRLLERRFGAVSPEAQARVETADLDTLTRWTDGLFTAESVEGVLNG
ncbi:MAG: Rpn family recombination-promoting nuclease/putative transposase [Alphaproteobacteria bacterium]|nr:Rpn family recombination-promoting nuclease/putative transposase [Alphaproteobacteria bacterium]